MKLNFYLLLSLLFVSKLQPKNTSGRYDTPSRKTSKKIQLMLERKANQMLLKASQTLENSTGLALGSSRRSAAGNLIELFLSLGSNSNTFSDFFYSSNFANIC